MYALFELTETENGLVHSQFLRVLERFVFTNLDEKNQQMMGIKVITAHRITFAQIRPDRCGAFQEFKQLKERSILVVPERKFLLCITAQ